MHSNVYQSKAAGTYFGLFNLVGDNRRLPTREEYALYVHACMVLQLTCLLTTRWTSGRIVRNATSYMQDAFFVSPNETDERNNK